MCEEVPATIIAIFAQCGLVVRTHHHDSCRTSVPKSWLTWLLCFIGLNCEAQQSFVLCSQCVDMRGTSHHHERVARSKKLGITWRWFYSSLLCEKSASVHQCFLCVVWSRDEHFAAFIVESSLPRVVVKVLLVVTGSWTQSCLFRADWLGCTHSSPSFEGFFWSKFIRDVFAWCGHVMFSASLQRTTMIYELFLWTDGEWKLAAHQMLFHAIAPAIALLLQLVRDVVSRSERWTWQGWFTMLLWWTPNHHDFGGTHSKRSPGLHFGCLHAVFIERRLSDYLCKCCIVWSRDTHTLRAVAFHGILSRRVGAHMELVQCCCTW